MADNGRARTGRSASEGTAAPTAAAAAASAKSADAARRQRDARASQPDDDITAMLRRSDALAGQSAELKQIADAARPLYNSLDDRQRRQLVQFVDNYMATNRAEDWRERR